MNYAASNEIDKKVSFQIDCESNEDLTEPPMSQSIVGSMPNEFSNDESPELSLNSCESPESVEALIDNLMSTDAFVNNMNWIDETENAQMDGFEDSFDKENSTEISTEISAVLRS